MNAIFRRMALPFYKELKWFTLVEPQVPVKQTEFTKKCGCVAPSCAHYIVITVSDIRLRAFRGTSKNFVHTYIECSKGYNAFQHV